MALKWWHIVVGLVAIIIFEIRRRRTEEAAGMNSGYGSFSESGQSYSYK